MVLCKRDIEERCIGSADRKPLIEDSCRENIKSCSYDLRMGDQYYYYKESDKDVNVRSLSKGERFKIPPDAICYVMTKERVNIPNDLTASISLPLYLIKAGVMLSVQPPYDPGYSGKTVALLHNLSDDIIEIKYGQHILNIVFTELSGQVDKLYDGDYQGLNDLKRFCGEVRVGAVFKLKQDLKKIKVRFNNSIPIILTLITAIVAVLTVLISFFTISDRLKPEQAILNQPQYIDSSQLYVDDENNTLSIEIDGKQYVIEINETLSDSKPNQ